MFARCSGGIGVLRVEKGPDGNIKKLGNGNSYNVINNGGKENIIKYVGKHSRCQRL